MARNGAAPAPLNPWPTRREGGDRHPKGCLRRPWPRPPRPAMPTTPAHAHDGEAARPGTRRRRSNDEQTYRRDATGLLVVDPYNDCLSEGGKLWPRLREVVEANGCVPHMARILGAARSAGLRVFFAPTTTGAPATTRRGGTGRRSRRPARARGSSPTAPGAGP